MDQLTFIKNALLSGGGRLLVDTRCNHSAENAGFIRIYGDGNRPDGMAATLHDVGNFKTSVLAVMIDVAKISRPVSYLCRLVTESHDRECTLVLGRNRVIISQVGFFSWLFPLSEAAPLVLPSRFNPDAALFEMQLIAADLAGRLVHPKWEQDLSPFEGSPDYEAYFPLSLRYCALLLGPAQAA